MATNGKIFFDSLLFWRKLVHSFFHSFVSSNMNVIGTITQIVTCGVEKKNHVTF